MCVCVCVCVAVCVCVCECACVILMSLFPLVRIHMWKRSRWRWEFNKTSCVTTREETRHGGFQRFPWKNKKRQRRYDANLDPNGQPLRLLVGGLALSYGVLMNEVP